ncbi:extracellular solute-binding protein [Microbacterium indicum]|uniref:extracellular solute-binding protein n=1 Tax=Microbacterium indicum TaxID=358100 RepID=UPI0003F66293|nr:extracellular solute-binding protein [Microbacterium indicum]
MTAPHLSAAARRRLIRTSAGIGLVGVLALAGCGRTDAAADSATTTVDDSPATGTVEVWVPDGDGTGLETVIEPFLEENPDVDVELTVIPEDEYNTKLSSAIAAGTAPDVAQLYTESQAQFIKGGSFAAVPDGLVDEDSFFSGAWDAGTVDGTTYSVPWYAYTYALVYRADLAAEAGVEAPTTWDEFPAFLQALQDAGADHGFSADVGWDSYTGQFVAQLDWQAGGDLISDDGSAWTLDTDEMVSALSHYASYFTGGYTSTDGPSFLDSQPYFVEGKTASIVTGPWVIGQYDDVAGQDGWTAENVATAPVPAGDGGSISSLGGGSWGVLADSDNSDASWKLIQYLSDEDTQLTQYADYGSLPAVESAWSDPTIADQSLLDAYFEQMKTARTYPQSTTWPQIATQLGAEMEAVARGTKTAEQAASDIQSFADSLGTGTE